MADLFIKCICLAAYNLFQNILCAIFGFLVGVILSYFFHNKHMPIYGLLNTLECSITFEKSIFRATNFWIFCKSQFTVSASIAHFPLALSFSHRTAFPSTQIESLPNPRPKHISNIFQTLNKPKRGNERI